MTKKELLLCALRDAKSAHEDLLRHAKILKSGIECIGADDEGVQTTKCPFSHWLQEYKPVLLKLHTCNAHQIVELESRHREMHELYCALIKKIKENNNNSFFSKLLHLGENKKFNEHILTRIYFRILYAEERFCQSLDLLIKRIYAIPENEIAALFNGER